MLTNVHKLCYEEGADRVDSGHHETATGEGRVDSGHHETATGEGRTFSNNKLFVLSMRLLNGVISITDFA